MIIHSVAVFCGSKDGIHPLYRQHAVELGGLIAQQQWQLVYGGGRRGLMGAVANAALEKKGAVLGIIPMVLNDREHQHDGLTELIVVPDMHARKKLLFEKSDAAIILPGGVGTLDELFEMLTWNQLKIHHKKIIFLNTNGFYEHLRAHIRHMEKESFLHDSLENSLIFSDSPAAIIELLK